MTATTSPPPVRPMLRVEVDAQALAELLRAVTDGAPPHLLRELQATRGTDLRSPIDVLVREYLAAASAHIALHLP